MRGAIQAEVCVAQAHEDRTQLVYVPDVFACVIVRRGIQSAHVFMQTVWLETIRTTTTFHASEKSLEERPATTVHPLPHHNTTSNSTTTTTTSTRSLNNPINNSIRRGILYSSQLWQLTATPTTATPNTNSRARSATRDSR